MKALIFALLLTVNQAYSSTDTIIGFDLIKGKNIKIDLDSKKKTVYYFLSAWCPCSQGTFDHLNKLQTQYKEFQFVGFHSSVAIPREDALEYFAKYKINFPIILDDKVVYANKFKALKTPHVFVHSPEGKVLFQGGATNSRNPKKASKFYLQEALESISKGDTPAIVNAKAIGCYIQREL